MQYQVRTIMRTFEIEVGLPPEVTTTETLEQHVLEHERKLKPAERGKGLVPYEIELDGDPVHSFEHTWPR